MSGKIVCKRTTEELAIRVASAYESAGLRPKILTLSDDTCQVLVRGSLVRRYTPAGVASSHGGGIPLLSAIDPALAAEVERVNATLPAFA